MPSDHRDIPEGPEPDDASVYDRLIRAVVAVCARVLRDELEDVEQQIRLKLLEAPPTERNPLARASYVYRTAARTAIDALRRHRVRFRGRVEAEGVEEVPDPRATEDEYARRELEGLVREQVERLTPDRRLVVGLYLRGMTAREIELMTTWSEAKVRNLLYKGLAEVRTALAAKGVDRAAIG